MRKPSKKIALVSLGAAGVLGLGIAVPAFAQQQDPTPNPSASASAHEQRQAALAEGLAKELGLPVDKVTAALEKVQGQLDEQAKADRLARLKTELDQAVTDGKLTRAQADAIYAAAQAGVLPRGLGDGRGHGPGRGGAGR
jgi:hypothetical protein